MSEAIFLSTLAALIAEPARAEILLALMDGRAFPACELASIAHITPPTASHHLVRLAEGGLIEGVRQGRHRYYKLAGPRVAEIIEALGNAQIHYRPQPRGSNIKCDLADCRRCYDHLAGKLGVEIRMSCEQNGWIIQEADRLEVTSLGVTAFRALGIDVGAFRQARRPLAKACLDWTERVPHIGGSLGRALLTEFLEQEWLVRTQIPRQLAVTPTGRRRLCEEFGVRAH